MRLSSGQVMRCWCSVIRSTAVGREHSALRRRELLISRSLAGAHQRWEIHARRNQLLVQAWGGAVRPRLRAAQALVDQSTNPPERPLGVRVVVVVLYQDADSRRSAGGRQQPGI